MKTRRDHVTIKSGGAIARQKMIPHSNPSVGPASHFKSNVSFSLNTSTPRS